MYSKLNISRLHFINFRVLGRANLLSELSSTLKISTSTFALPSASVLRELQKLEIIITLISSFSRQNDFAVCIVPLLTKPRGLETSCADYCFLFLVSGFANLQ